MLSYLVLSALISAFAYWYTGVRLGGMIVKCICALHLVWTATLATQLYKPEWYERAIQLISSF